jgi:hypothetical protein
MHEIRTIWLANFWERVNYKAKFETGGVGGREIKYKFCILFMKFKVIFFFSKTFLLFI